jgi:hypothetical protein
MPALRISRFALVAVLTTACLPAASRADRVTLVNGRVLDDVVAVARADGLEIQMGGGAMTLPHSQVRSIESSAATLTEYRERARALEADPGTTAGDWLELALWARARRFDFGVREAALRAAAMAPDLPGLAETLRDLGYERDPGTGRWAPLADVMRARGWVRDEGEWVPAEIAARRAEARVREQEARRREAEAARLDRLTELVEARALAGAAPPAEPAVWGVPIWGYGFNGASMRPGSARRSPQPPLRIIQLPPPPPPRATPEPRHTTSRPPAR